VHVNNLFEIKSITRLSIKQPQTPELAYDSFRTVMSATSNLNDNNVLHIYTPTYMHIINVENADRYGFELREHRGGHDPAASVGSSRHQTGALQVLQPGRPRYSLWLLNLCNS